jgi:hypothetical protein
MLHLALTLERSPTDAGFTAAADRWPCHATVLQSFRVDAPLDAVLAVVRARAAATDGPVTPIGDHVEGFGPERDIRVTVLGRADRIVALHTDLVSSLATLDGFAPDVPEWAGEGFRPHVTAGAWGELAPGDEVTFDRIAVVDVEAPDARPVVLAVTPLGAAARRRL